MTRDGSGPGSGPETRQDRGDGWGSGRDASSDGPVGRPATADALLVVAAGTTATAREPGLSAAGARPAILEHTPSVDAEILTYGAPVSVDWAPVSPTGCPTPAAVTRAVRELLGFGTVVVDSGLAAPTAAPVVPLGASPGRDVRRAEAVPDAAGILERAERLGGRLPVDRLLLGETVPGGTTTALGVLRALGEPGEVSSSLATNPLERKREVVSRGLAASDLSPGDLADEPVEAIRRMGDPTIAALAGLARGALTAGTSVTLAGGTQLLAVAAVLRRLGVDAPLHVATTAFVARDPTVDLSAQAAAVDARLTVTDPDFDRGEHPALSAYEAGEVKEGVAMGGALALAASAGLEPAAVRERTVRVVDRLLDATIDHDGGPRRDGSDRGADPARGAPERGRTDRAGGGRSEGGGGGGGPVDHASHGARARDGPGDRGPRADRDGIEEGGR